MVPADPEHLEDALQGAPRRPDDDARVEALSRLLLDSAPEPRFDAITDAAVRLLGVPVALINLVDADRQWTKSHRGVQMPDLPRTESICDHVVARDRLLEVPDLAADERFAASTTVEDGLRFYAGVPVHDPEGQPVGTLCVLDRTPHELEAEQREILAALGRWVEAELNARVVSQAARTAVRSEQQLRELLDGAPGGVLLLDAELRVSWANAAASSVFDRPAGGLRGTRLPELLPTLDPRDVRGHGRRRGDSSRGRRLLAVARRSDGTHFTVELFVRRVPGATERYAVFARDLAREDRERQELALLRERTDVVFDALAEGVMVVESDGSVSYANLAAARLLRTRRDDALGRPWHDVADAGCTDPSCPLRDLLASVGRRLSPVRLRRSDGDTVPVEVSVQQVRSGDVEFGVVVTLDDLTERLEVDRLKSEFVSAVSHELRTPLTSIRGSLGLLNGGVVDPASERGRRMLSIAAASTDRLGRLVNDLLDLEKLQSGRVELDLRDHRVEQLMQSAAQAVSGAAADAGVPISVGSTGAVVLADGDRVVQVLVNLLGNAVKFSPPGAPVELTADEVDGTVRVSVSDRGRGIPADQLERVFDRFAQVDATDRRERSGTGLGLAIARALAEQHGGRLTVASTEGSGSTFTVELPVVVRRRLFYAPATEVPPDVTEAVGSSFEVVAAEADAVTASGAAVLLGSGSPEQVDRVREAAARAHLPVVGLATLDAVPVDGGDGSDLASVAALAADGRAHHVLVVEDDADLAEVLATLLRQHRLSVAVAPDEAGALRAVAEHAPDLLLLDLVLLSGDGYGVVAALRRDPALAELPVVVYSALEPLDAERAQLHLGPTTFLTKTRNGTEEVGRAVLQLLEAAAVPHRTQGRQA